MSESLPSKEEALKLLKKSGCSNKVINHCKTVAALAKEIAEACKKKGLNINIELVEIGALLHDIGRAKTYSVHHIVEGAKIAKKLGLPKSIISIIERHVGGGITTEEAKKLGWPAKSYMPRTIEEKIVSYADKLVEGTRRISIERTIKKFSKKHGKDHPSIKRMQQMHMQFQLLIGDIIAKKTRVT